MRSGPDAVSEARLDISEVIWPSVLRRSGGQGEGTTGGEWGSNGGTALLKHSTKYLLRRSAFWEGREKVQPLDERAGTKTGFFRMERMYDQKVLGEEAESVWKKRALL